MQVNFGVFGAIALLWLVAPAWAQKQGNTGPTVAQPAMTEMPELLAPSGAYLAQGTMYLNAYRAVLTDGSRLCLLSVDDDLSVISSVEAGVVAATGNPFIITYAPELQQQYSYVMADTPAGLVEEQVVWEYRGWDWAAEAPELAVALETCVATEGEYIVFWNQD